MTLPTVPHGGGPVPVINKEKRLFPFGNSRFLLFFTLSGAPSGTRP